MYAGHFGAALGAFRMRRTTALGWLVGAALLPDLTHVALQFGGLADPMWVRSHGIPAVLLQALVAGVVATLAIGDRRAGLLVGATVLSHLPLDYLTGTKLPLWAGGPLVGLQLYQKPALDFTVEAALIAAGWLAYRSALGPTLPRRWPTLVMLGGLLVLQGAAVALMAQ